MTTSKHFVDVVDADAEENWAVIPAYPTYEVSSLGRVRNAKNQRILAQRLQAAGFPIVNMLKDGKIHSRLVHTLVMRAFVGEPGEGEVTRHVDGSKVNNGLGNLKYAPARSTEPKVKKPRVRKNPDKVTEEDITALEELASGVDNPEEL